MTDRELIQQALETLDGTEALLTSMGVTHLLIYGEVDKAIAALRERLAQPEMNQWHGLTDDEADELVARFARYELLRRVEAKLKEKNI